MIALDIILDGDGCWPDVRVNPDVQFNKHTAMSIARLRGGMTSGKGSVAVRLDMADGRVVIAETSMTFFLAAADAFRARAEHEKGADAVRPLHLLGEQTPVIWGVAVAGLAAFYLDPYFGDRILIGIFTVMCWVIIAGSIIRKRKKGQMQ